MGPGQYIMPMGEFRKIILRSYYLRPRGISDSGSSYVPIDRKTFNELKKDPAFTESQIKSLEARVID